MTYRSLPWDEVLRRAADAGLRTIEWGADVHAPSGDASRLAEVRDATAGYGLRVAAYGSYFRAGPHGAEEFAPVLAGAVALGAPRIRIWAGTLGSALADPDAVAAVVRRSREAAERAADQGVELGFEFHRNTLTDTVDSTLRLLDAVDQPNVSTYWQPPVGAPDDEAVANLEAVRDRVCALHVFSWWPETERLRLAERRELWRRVFAVAGDASWDALLEFVPDDDPELLDGEAATLAELLGADRTAG
ncbi:MAG: sugar phosphate isomerase/epimerase family protein [Micromonosporaceae bacterium]